jgi:hypothetical protein
MFLGADIYSTNGLYTTLDANAEKVGHCGVFITPDGATRSITHICFSVRTKTINGDLICQLESVDSATGLYNGIIAAGATATETIDAAGFYEVELTTPYTLTSNTTLAVTFELSGTGNFRIGKGRVNHVSVGNDSWIVEALGGSAAAKTTAASNVALKCSTGEYLIPDAGDMQIADLATSIKSDATIYAGNKIICGITSRLSGVRLMYLDIDYDLKVLLVDADGNTLKADDTTTDMSITLSAQYRAATSSVALTTRSFPKPKTLAASAAYYLVYEAQTTDIVYSAYLTYPTEALKKQVHHIPSGYTINSVTATSGFSVTEDNATIRSILPVFNQIDIPAGGSGGGPVYGDRNGGKY